MKKLLTAPLIVCSICVFAQRQSILPVNAKSVKPEIATVMADYYDQFLNIKGDTISETKSAVEFQSKVIPEGALRCSITEIKSLYKVCSWQAVMYSSEDFQNAVEKYRRYFIQLNGASFMMEDHHPYRFKGVYDIPAETRAFASSILEPEVQQAALQKVKIEVALNYGMPDWTVSIYIYSKENDADIRPTEKTDQ